MVSEAQEELRYAKIEFDAALRAVQDRPPLGSDRRYCRSKLACGWSVNGCFGTFPDLYSYSVFQRSGPGSRQENASKSRI